MGFIAWGLFVIGCCLVWKCVGFIVCFVWFCLFVGFWFLVWMFCVLFACLLVVDCVLLVFELIWVVVVIGSWLLFGLAFDFTVWVLIVVI